jgi:predicted Abi (CAAX) family protease
MKPGRLSWLLLALAGTAALAAFGSAPDETVRAAGAVMTTEHLPVIRALEPRKYAPATGGDPFAATQPANLPGVSPAERADAVPPAPSLAAPLPWRVLGKQLDDDEGWAVFLARGDETWVVRSGDTLDDTYRVVAIVPPTLTLLHLKQKTRRTLDIGEAKE